jgi:AraC-like DNA-binding protein
MKELINLAKITSHDDEGLPFSVYSSMKEQRISNVPVLKPLLICVLAGLKQLGRSNKVECPSGNFVFLSNSPNVDMRNIPDEEEYFAVLIEFDYSDFDQFKHKPSACKKYFQGEINSTLEKALQQYIEWSVFAPSETLHFRKRELLQLIYLSGYEDVAAIAEPPSLSHQVYDIMNDNISGGWGVERLAAHLTMSESTLRRKLKAEGTSIQAIRNRTKLGHGLHLVQTTMEHIGRISERCGYQSQSRFTDQFKQQFGMTPTELRRTRMHD